MLTKLKKLYRTLGFVSELPIIFNKISNLEDKINEQKILSGKLLSELNKAKAKDILNNIQLAEFKVFSQWGDDGIIQFLVNYLDIKDKTFIEFGVENYQEANTRFLLINNNWTGLIIDGSVDNINQVKRENIYWRHELTAVNAFITKENINKLISLNGFKGDIGLLHIDIDGNDYWVWNEISVISPVIAIIEYNSVFGLNPWTVPYDKKFFRTEKHFSNLYFGSSLLSLFQLATKKGYVFIGCNSNGNNAYFIRKDKLKKLKPLDPNKAYVFSKFRESRDMQGNLTHISGSKRIDIIKGLPVFNTKTNKIQNINEK